MNQIKSIQLGVIAICIATVPLSLAQTPRTRTSGSNQTITITTAAPRLTGSSGNSTGAPQIGINPGSAANIGLTTNAGARTTTNAGVQLGIQTIGITRAVVGNGISSGNSMRGTQNGINTPTSTNTTTNTAAETRKTAGTGSGVKKITLPEVIIESTPSPDLFTSTPTSTPIPTPTPTPFPLVSLNPLPSP
jgi:hypothetical protein